jgi:type II secretory pathway component PulJ
MPGLCRRFSLKTLLIATTLVAVVLGLAFSSLK